MPSGTRSFIDSMDKLFNFNIPMYKNGSFKINMLNSGIFDENLKKDIENYVTLKINDFLPIYSKLLGFEWINSSYEPLFLEGDYNISNSLTDIIQND
jgi:hypothetical protein